MSVPLPYTHTGGPYPSCPLVGPPTLPHIVYRRFFQDDERVFWRTPRGHSRLAACAWSFYIFGAPNQLGEVRTPLPADGKLAPHAIPSELLQPDPETAIDAVARLSVVRRLYGHVTYDVRGRTVRR